MRAVFFILLAVNSLQILAQVGGNAAYTFLNLMPNARIGALGGYAIATPEHDLGLALQNPSLLNQHFNNQISLNYINYFADITAGNFAYAGHLNKHNLTMAGGIHYVNYGNFARTAPDGAFLGTFNAGDYAFYIQGAKQVNENWSFGASLKFIYSNLDVYNSFGAAADMAATYYSNDKLFTAAAVVSNIGSQITTYNRQDNFEPLPTNLQLGIVKKFKHNPLRIGLILHHLNKPGQLLYQIANRNNSNINLETGEPIAEKFTILDHALSHMVLNTELVLGQNLRVRFGYNYLRRRELGITDFAGTTGFSWGFGLKLSKFIFSYGSANYHLGNSTNQFSVVTNISDFFKKKEPKP
jgi:hypothetical protein